MHSILVGSADQFSHPQLPSIFRPCQTPIHKFRLPSLWDNAGGPGACCLAGNHSMENKTLARWKLSGSNSSCMLLLVICMGMGTHDGSWVWVPMDVGMGQQSDTHAKPTPIAMGVAPMGIWQHGKQCHCPGLFTSIDATSLALHMYVYFILFISSTFSFYRSSSCTSSATTACTHAWTHTVWLCSVTLVCMLLFVMTHQQPVLTKQPPPQPGQPTIYTSMF